MNNIWRRRAAGLAVISLLAGVALMPMAAMADSFAVDLPRSVRRGDPGSTHHLRTYSVPDSLIGQSCTVEALGNNNHSVHRDNNIVVSSVNSVTLVDVEEFPNKDTMASGLLTMSDSVTFTLVMGADGVYSANFRVVFECQPEQTTTTTIPETTTTVPETTTTVPETTTTVPETTTTVPGSTTSTTVQVSTTSTVPETTTTVVVGPTTTTPTTSDTLPFTGVDSDQLAIVALLALGAGSGLVALSGRSKEEQTEVF